MTKFIEYLNRPATRVDVSISIIALLILSWFMWR